jgi:heme/copper-type cytochrome/quinol oxidase subunit 3
MHGYQQGFFTLKAGLFLVLLTSYAWWRDIVREGTYEGQHTKAVQTGLRIGMLLFIVSELMFFVSFFWAFFHSALAPTPEIGSVWPPKGIETIWAWEIPMLNTAVLLTSGATITWAHHAIVAGDKTWALYGLLATIGLALYFTFLQHYEYRHCKFTMSDGIYGSTFFITTGFHGLHVIIGTIFIIVQTVRLFLDHFTREHHFGFEAAAWYWHFVDVVWLFLFVTIYWWGDIH